MISFLGAAAGSVRDLAILTAAAIALLGFMLGMRTRIEARTGSVVVWRLPLFRHVTIRGQAWRSLSAQEVAEDTGDAVREHNELAAEAEADAAASAAEDSPLMKISAWFHIPAAIDRSRDPIELPAFSVPQTRQSQRKRLRLSATPPDTGGRFRQAPSILIEVPDGQRTGSAVDLRGPEAGRLRDAIVGSWASRLWN